MRFKIEGGLTNEDVVGLDAGEELGGDPHADGRQAHVGCERPFRGDLAAHEDVVAKVAQPEGFPLLRRHVACRDTARTSGCETLT